MNIDRYRAMLTHRLADEQRARIEEMLAEANRAFDAALRRLAFVIKTDEPDSGANRMLS